MARKLLHIPEAAEQLGISVATLRFWLSRSYGPPSARIGKRVVFDQDQLDRWVDEQFAAAADARKGA